MFFRSLRPTIMDEIVQTLLESLVTNEDSPIITAPKAHLLADMSGLSSTSLAADFMAKECTFTGYIKPTITPLGPGNFGAGLWVEMFSTAFFLAGNPLTSGPQNAVGYWVDDNDTDLVLCFEAFPAPIPFAVPFAFLNLEIVVPILQTVQIPA